MDIRVLVGSKKGAFILESNEARRDWRMRGPFCEHWPLTHMTADPATGAIYATGGNAWFGPAVWRSRDFGATWTHSSQGLAYPEGETPIQCAWSVLAAHGRLYVGVEPAGLFVSDDGGDTFRELDGLRRHPTRPQWQPGGAGLILHSIVADPADPRRLWVGISAVGVFYSEDGGESWSPRNSGTRCDFLPEGQRYPEFGQCVHNLTLAPGHSNRLYQQNHCGMYRSDDGGASWRSIEAGLPSSFGFPVAAHPRDPDTLFFLPLNGAELGRYPPDARAAVWRSRDGGARWTDLREGLPQSGAYFGVMRQAMATDSLKPAGVYFGASNGSVYASRDEGESWACLARDLPAISSIETQTIV
jgi:BNR/Asp-box repeat